MSSTMTPNMGLTVPATGTEQGPDYALEINADLSTLDQHNHTTGNGVPIPSSGLNINADLPMGSNNLTLARSIRFAPQGSPLALGTDLGCIYESGVDLYYNDGNGNQIRITAAGSVAGATGSITGLVSPASASYSPGSATFTWQSNSNVAANMDFRSAILRNSTVSSNGITLSAPSSLPGNYTLTLPSTLPAGQRFATIDNSGNVAASWNVDNTTIEVSSNLVQIKDGGVTNAKLANDSVATANIQDFAVTNAKLAAINMQTSASSGSFTTTSSTPVAVTNLSTVITTVGRPVQMILNSASVAFAGSPEGVIRTGTGIAYLIFYRDTTPICSISFTNGSNSNISGSAYSFIDSPTAGNYGYSVKVCNLSSQTTTVDNCLLVTREL